MYIYTHAHVYIHIHMYVYIHIHNIYIYIIIIYYNIYNLSVLKNEYSVCFFPVFLFIPVFHSFLLKMTLLRGTSFLPVFFEGSTVFPVFFRGGPPVRTNAWNPPVLLRFYTGFTDGVSFRRFRRFGLPVPQIRRTGFLPVFSTENPTVCLPCFFTDLLEKNKKRNYRFSDTKVICYNIYILLLYWRQV